MTLFNILGYEAVRRLNAVIRPDVNKPLGAGLPSKVRIVGGEITYGVHKSDDPLLQVDALNGTVGAITGVDVKRGDDGRLHATIRILGPYSQFRELNKLAGIGDFEFFCSDEFISNDIEHPTIFQNIVQGGLKAGTRISLLPGLPDIGLPVGFATKVFTDAIGFVDGDTFRGVASFDYYYEFEPGPLTGIAVLDAMFADAPRTGRLEGTSEFKVLVKW
jgi:hypothetical protein